MSLIEWSRLPGEAIEDAVAMLLCAENFEATQVQPGKGDGGIDVFVPISDDLSIREIYQVKRYSKRLTSSEKRKIKNSLDKVVNTAKDQGWTISVWRLVLPLNPTPNDLRWLDTLSKDHLFPCRWVGLNRIEALVAKHPQITDYYLRDGRERLQQQMDRLTAIIARRETRESGEELRPIDVTSDLRSIYSALNECDPHYRYEISMTANPPSASSDAPANSPGLVAIFSTGSEGSWVNVSIFARSLAAMEKRPITGTFKVNVPSDAPVRESYDKFINYGTPVSLPSGLATVNLDLPGGLGGEINEPVVTIGASTKIEDQDEAERDLVVAILSPDEGVLAEIEVKQVEVTVGQAGGRRTVWTDEPGFITLEILAKKYPDLTANISIQVAASGEKPAAIVSSLEFLANMHKPNTMAISQAFGPRNFATGSSELKEKDGDYSRLAKLARALATIQDYTSTRIRFPEIVTGEQAINIIDSAKILSGNPISATWDRVKIDRDTNADPETFSYEVGDEVDLRLIRDIAIELDQRVLVVGRQAALMRGVVKEFTAETAVFEPAQENPKATLIRFDGDEEVNLVQARPVHPTNASGTDLAPNEGA
ncbi:restriction endonuclease [Rhodococcus sp. NPDC057014]|uniref:restriction endonuclease n=1 Tax=Rhodococcus sp. NPDC057014 TaxID=3346000 RepID=UPI0036429652